jgi:hypothetical protein
VSQVRYLKDQAGTWGDQVERECRGDAVSHGKGTADAPTCMNHACWQTHQRRTSYTATRLRTFVLLDHYNEKLLAKLFVPTTKATQLSPYLLKSSTYQQKKSLFFAGAFDFFRPIVQRACVLLCSSYFVPTDWSDGFVLLPTKQI